MREISETVHHESAATLAEALRLRAALSPERRAYTFLADGEDEAEHLNYRELDERARAIAAALRRTCGTGDRALLLFPPGLDFVAAFFGCLYAGVIAVPAYPPRSPRMLPRLQSILEDSEPAAALSTSAASARVAGWLEKEGIQGLPWLATDEISLETAAEWRDPEPPGDAIAFLQYTSGSTSAPKGVMVSHANLAHNQRVIQSACGHSEESVFVSWLPLYHDLGLIGNLLQATWVGAPCVLMSPVAFLQNPSRWLKAVSRYRGTTSGGPNFAYELCLRKVPAAERERLDLSSWRVAFNGAEPVRAETLARFAEAFAPAGLSRRALYPCYGLAEATLMVSGGWLEEPPVVRGYDAEALAVHRAEPGADRELVGSGHVLLDLRAAIVDPETGRPRAPGGVGEVWVAGDSVAAGYWNRPEETARTFGARLPDGDGPFLRTGDLGFLDDGGELFITGRIKDLIILRGRNHYPQDIELTAERSHPALRGVVGAAFSVEAAGEERLVVVHEVDRHAAGLDEVAEAVRRAVAEEHEALVHEVVLVPQGGVPRTTSGKIQRRGCRELYLSGGLNALSRSRLDGMAELEAAEGPLRDALLAAPAGERLDLTERWLRRTFARLAKVDGSRIDPEKPLSGFGMDSLVAVELKNAVEDEAGVALPISGLLEGMSLREAALRILEPVPVAEEPELAQGPAVGDFPLSWGQRSLWFLHRLAPESAAYNIAGAARLEGAADPERLRRALQALVDRHPGLRATFVSTSEGPVQRISERAEAAFLREDARVWSEDELRRRMREEAFRPFDLERGPVFRAALFEREDGARLVLAVHHVAADFWSLAVMARELGAFYRDGEAAGLPAPVLHYTDFARWQERRLEGPWGEDLWAHWRHRLAGAPPLDLPADRPRPAAQGVRGAALGRRLGSGVTARLHSVAGERGCTLFMTLAAAWSALLARHPGQEDFLVGTPTAGRPHARLAGVVGYFVNPVALRADLADDPTAGELLGRFRTATLEALQHADFPFALLAERLRPEREPGRPPLVQTMVALQKSPAPDLAALAAFAVGEPGARLELGGLTLESIALESPASQLDLTLMAAELGGDLALSLQFDSDLFDAATAGRILARFGELARSLAEHPERRVSGLDVLTGPERRQVLEEWSRTGPAASGEPPVHRRFEEQARLAPHRLAVVDGTSALTYGTLNARANRLARRLRGFAVVAVCMERSADLVVALLAVLKAGGAYVPIDPSYPAERRTYLLEDSGAATLLTRDSLPRESGDDPGDPDTPSLPGDRAYVIYTSGSTGRPKGVQIAHEGLSNLVRWHRDTYGVGPEDRATLVASPAFDASVWEIWPYLTAGASLHIPDEGTRAQPARLAAWMADQGITLSFLPTPLAEAVLDEPWPAAIRLRALLTGGDRLRRTPRPGLPFRLFNHYGPTECSVVTTWTEVPPDPDGTLPPLGRPISGLRVHVLGRHGEPAPPGAPGEICVAGPGLARGYLGRPERTAERSVPDPFGDGERLYRTGDLARWRAGGDLDFLGRIDRQVKIRGVRIELGEIEAALAAFPTLREAVVEARDLGAGPALVAWVVAREGEALDVRELAAFLRGTLPEALVPSAFVPLPALPLTVHGKIDRQALPDPVPGERETEEPRTAVERLLAGIWADLLGADRIGLRDGFFDLGGHSLLAARMVSRVREALGVEVPLSQVFASSTLADFAAAVERTRSDATGSETAIPPVPRNGDLPASFAQERLWLLEGMAPGIPVYNVPAVLRLRGRLSVPALAAALDGIARRHEALRTTLPEVAGGPVQRVHPPAPFPLHLEDLAGGPDPEAAARRLAGEEAARSFDLQRGPLARAVLLRLAPEDYWLCLTLHHTVTDGWSTGLLLRELAALYQESADLPDLPVQYADYAAWQRSALSGEALEERLGRWRRRLEAAPTVLELPADRPRPARQSFRGDIERLDLGSLEAVGRRGTTPFMVLLAAFQALLGRYTGRQDLLTGAPVANRGRREAEGLIGFFVNLLALRADLAGDPTFGELTARVRRSVLEDFAYEDVPFEKVVEAVAPGRDLSRPPLVQAVFTLQNALPPLELAPGLEARVEEVHSGTAKFDLTVFVEEGAGGFEARAEYASDLFDAATVQRLLGHFRVLLEGIAANPEARLSALPMLSGAERRQLVLEWNEAPAESLGAETLHERFAAQAARSPEAVAVVCEGASLTYGDLDRRGNQIANHLIGLGVVPGDLVGLRLERSLEMVAAILGVLKAGAAYVPLDPAYPAERLAFMIEDSGVSIVLTGESLAGIDGDSSDPRIPLSADHPAYVIYTSGSTGSPKGVVVRHGNVTRLFSSTDRWFGFGPEDVWTLFHSYAFDFSVWEIWGALLYGGRLVVVPYWVSRTPEAFHELLREKRVTVLNQTPSAFRQLIWAGEGKPTDLALRYVIFGGEALEPASLAPWFERYGDERPRLINMYGITETTVHVTYQEVSRRDVASAVGRPIPDLGVYLLDPALNLVPVGVPGEILVGGAGLALGYLNRPELTAERFIPNPFGEPGSRLYRSGDLARRRPDGDLEYLGRIDHQVKIRGFRIELGEIEAALVRHPAVREAVVLVREDRLVAWVAGDAVTLPELRAFAGAHLPDYMLPSALVVLDKLPLTANGKVDRRALPEPDREDHEGTAEAPRTPVEELLAGIWAGLLGRERIGVHEDFFAAGGHSLLAARLVSRLRGAFGVEMPLTDVFAHPTVAGLAREVERVRRSGAAPEAPPLVPARREGALPLSFSQERLWFLERLEEGGAVYNVPMAFRLRGPLDAEALAAALREVARRHEALRTTFVEEHGKPRQAIATEPSLKLRSIETDETGAARLLEEEARRPFDLERGPLGRATLVRLGEEDHVFLLTLHHLVADGWSLGVLFDELAALYAGAAAPPLPLQYADYAVWQRGWLAGEALEARMAFW
ncbi:MAG TPA: amino acid adenylation domain-containing protein, partial [Thermoanaerobaculia bacterium]|nr:amino acid adenylation domain-containing protein [Thermoanaerobaculia bacterium]